jgi:5'-methylthioadenosine phosphorylase
MGRLAVILGSNALGPGGEEIAAAAAEHGAAIVQRHGVVDAAVEATYVLPHEIDHAANLRPLAEQGCDRVLAIGSVGSLSPELPVGSLLCPDDFIALGIGPSVFADARAHSAPGFDPRWRGEVIEAWQAGGQAPREGGVYWQTRGPRFETPAEIRLIAVHADVVGMTIASECVVAGELGLDYAALCVVDNLANGVGEGELDVAGLEDDRIANATRLRDGLAAVLPQLGAVGR